MSEAIVQFGRQHHLTGILCRPTQHDSDIAVVIISAGATHKVGPFRLGVDVARHFNHDSLCSLRFDLGGIGESRYLKGNGQTYDQHIASDLTDCLDFLQSNYGFTKFIAVGLCTGADNAHKLAVADKRVIGVVCLDGYAYPTWRFYLINSIRKIEKIRRLPAMVVQKIKQMIKGQSDNRLSESEQYLWHLPPKYQFLSDMSALAERKVDYAAFFSGGVSIYFNYASQFTDAIERHPIRPYVTSTFFEKANHTYMLQVDRRELLNAMSQWSIRVKKKHSDRAAP